MSKFTVASKKVSSVGAVTGFACLLVVIAVAPIAAGGYFVATNGNDGAAGTESAPYATISKGITSASAGDTVYVRSGTYNQAVTISKSGSAEKHIVIRSYPGETAVLDGQNTRPASKWNGLFQLNGASFIEINGFVVRNSIGRGIHTLNGSNIRVLNSTWHNSQGSAMNIRTSHSLIENNVVYNSCLENSASPGATGSGWPGVLMVDRTNNCTVRGNRVYNNWGEGIIDLICENTIIEDNVVWNNWALGIYLDHSANSTVRRNLVFYDNDKNYWRFLDRPAIGIGISNESYYSDVTTSLGRNQTIINNIVFRCGDGFNFFKVGAITGSKLNGTVIANNTFVENYKRGISISTPQSGSHENVRVFNTIVLQTVGIMAEANDVNGITFSHNCWSASPDIKFRSSNDVIGDPMLARTGSTAVQELTGSYFKLASGSPCIDKALALSEVSEDFFGTNRGNAPDIGIHEYQSTTYAGLHVAHTFTTHGAFQSAFLLNGRFKAGSALNMENTGASNVVIRRNADHSPNAAVTTIR